MNNHGNISDKDFSSLKRSFTDDFTASVMERVANESRDNKGKVLRMITNTAVVAAAACIVLAAFIGYSGESGFSSDEFLGLSEYSDFELQESGYFDEESIAGN